MTYVAEVAPMLTGAANRTGGDRPPGPQVDTAETLVVAKALLGHHGRIDEDTETFVTHTLRAEGHDASEDGTGRGVLDMAVRRLTPLECARLQAFPDDWLDGLNLSDSARYRMLGNAITVSVAEWIGNQLMEVV